MNDCQNAEIRDQLPDLLHDRLGASRRAEILAHVATCVDCREEIELLRAARAMFEAQTPRVDVNYVVSALPQAKPRPVGVEQRRPRWTDWRIAAAVTLLVAGGSSLAVLSRNRSPVSVQDTLQSPPPAVATAPADSTSASDQVQPAPAPAPHAVPTRSTVLASDDQNGLGSSRLGDLTEQQLKTLLSEIDQIQATPITDPEPVSIKVGGNTSGGPEGA